MANDKYYTRTKEIRGKEYTAQFSGLTAAMNAIDSCYIDGSSNISVLKLSEYVFKHVIVQPKNLAVDDFDDIEELNEVVSWARDVMQGKFREAENPGAAKKGSGK